MNLHTTDISTRMGPLRVHPENRRYFTNPEGRVVYLAGSHVWQNLQDRGFSDPPPVFDFDAYVEFMRANHHNFTRLWVWEESGWGSWSTDRYFSDPMPYLRTGPGVSTDGKPRYDLDEFNPVYFDRLRSRVAALGEAGIYVAVMLFQGWSIEPKIGPGNPWFGHPLNGSNNINKIDATSAVVAMSSVSIMHAGGGTGQSTHTLLNRDVLDIQRRYVKRVVETVNDLDNVLFEISNESDASSTEWQHDMIQFVKECEADLAEQHPVGMTFQFPVGTNLDLYASSADWISPGRAACAPFDYRNDPPSGDGDKVVIVDTDHLWGEGGSVDWVWRTFTRGHNLMFMDGGIETFPPSSDWRHDIRLALSQTRLLSERFDMTCAVPDLAIASSGYCLAGANEWIIYLADAPSATLHVGNGTFSVEWIWPPDPGTGSSTVSVDDRLDLRCPSVESGAAAYIRRLP